MSTARNTSPNQTDEVESVDIDRCSDRNDRCKSHWFDLVVFLDVLIHFDASHVGWHLHSLDASCETILDYARFWKFCQNITDVHRKMKV